MEKPEDHSVQDGEAKHAPVAANENRARKAAREIDWNRGDFEDWRAGLSPERRAEDAQKLAKIFNLAAEVPETDGALDWARRHGVEFVVDRVTKARGYYKNGAGIVAVADRAFVNPRNVVGTLVHEIRHAWQDHYGMIATTQDSLSGYFMRQALTEADATAHQKLAGRQFDIASEIGALGEAAGVEDKKRKAALEEKLRETMRLPEPLWEDFKNWYRERALSYGYRAEKKVAARLRLKVRPGDIGLPTDRKLEAPGAPLGREFQIHGGRRTPPTPGLDVTDEAQVRRLGKGFRGGNYFNAADRDLLLREFLSPARAASLYRDTGTPEARLFRRDPLADRLRRRLLRNKYGSREIQGFRRQAGAALLNRAPK